VNITTFNYDKGQKQENLPLINWCEETRCWLLDLVCDAIAGLVQYFLFHSTHNILKEQEMLCAPWNKKCYVYCGTRNVADLFCYGFAWFGIRGLWFVFLC
jgi:hypothetical protein